MRRHQRRERDPLAGQCRQQGLRIEAAMVIDDDGRAHVHEGGAEIEGIGMAHRHHQQAGVVRREPHLQRRRERDQRAAGMAADGTLRPPGGARGVHQRTGLVGADLRQHAAALGAFDQRLVALPTTRGLVVEHDVAGLRDRQFGAHRRHGIDELGARDQRRGLAVAEDVGDLGRAQAEIERHCDQPGAGQANVDLHPFDAVVGEHADPVTAVEPEREQRVGQHAGPAIPLGIGQRTVRIPGSELVRIEAGMGRHGVGNGQQMVHGSSPQGVLISLRSSSIENLFCLLYSECAMMFLKSTTFRRSRPNSPIDTAAEPARRPDDPP